MLDIETSPNTAHVWGLWNQNVSINQLLESSYTLCWAAKWLGESEVMYDSIHQSPPKRMIKRIHALLEQADAVVHYHGTSFDIPTLNKEFILFGYGPPSPYKQIDLLKTVRRRFRFASNKLGYVAERLGLGKKYEHEGHTLWIRCMDGKDDAWQEMEQYNRHDVVLLERLYHKLLPWITNHPNRSVYAEQSICPTCGSTHYQKRGYAVTHAGKYQRYQCQDCFSWFRGIKRVNSLQPDKKVSV
jgi:hypothetical protein